MMFTGEATMGGSGLLRVAGLPIRYWLAGANPKLFEKAVHLERVEKKHRIHCAELAERIGQQLVPIPALSRDDRRFLLEFRRSLHRGDPIASTPLDRLLNISGLGDADAVLIQELAKTVACDREIAQLDTELQADLAGEQARLPALVDEIYDESPVAKALLAPRKSEKRTASRLERKSRQRQCALEWRCITRAATGCTPRGWLSHVALLPIVVDAAPPLAVTGDFAAKWMENVRARSLALTEPPPEWPLPDTLLALNPLRWDGDGCLVCVVFDEKREPTQVAVRHTQLLRDVGEALGDAARTFGELARALGHATQDEWVTFRGFVRHLVVLGIVQPCTPPESRFEQHAVPGRDLGSPAKVEDDTSGWTDVYRHVENGIPANVVRDVQAGVSEVFRILGLIGDATPDACEAVASPDDRSWSLIEILKAELAAGAAPAGRAEAAAGLERAGDDSSSDPGLDTLIGVIRSRAAQASEIIVDSSLLDQCQAAQKALLWPVDCLVRVPSQGADFKVVLDQLWPPGMLDSRFMDTLVDLHGPPPSMEAYQAFLEQVERQTGILFVELLLPPLHDGAANAVRRPLYTRAWTGDPHTVTYLRSESGARRYVPLSAIRIRRTGGRLRADVDDQPIWPIYHATRSFSPPWDRIARVLLATAPLNLPWDFQSMMRSFTELPGLTAVPRISVSGGMVLSPARWRISPEHLWDANASATTKVRALVRLRDHYRLPRWVCIDHGHKKPASPCDLESVHAISTIDRYSKTNAPLTVTEMLPEPDRLLVLDGAHATGARLAAQLHLRFPYDESVADMASRTSSAVSAALGQRHALRAATAASFVGRRPPSHGQGLTIDISTEQPRRSDSHG